MCITYLSNINHINHNNNDNIDNNDNDMFPSPIVRSAPAPVANNN